MNLYLYMYIPGICRCIKELDTSAEDGAEERKGELEKVKRYGLVMTCRCSATAKIDTDCHSCEVLMDRGEPPMWRVLLQILHKSNTTEDFMDTKVSLLSTCN